MAKFTFRMQGILNIKEKLEDQAKNEFGLANRKLMEEEDKLRALVVRRAEYEQGARQLRMEGKPLRPLELEEQRRSIETMKVLIRAQMMEVKRAEKDVDFARAKLNEAMQERKMYEKLREKAFEEFKAEIAYEENKAVDQLVSYTYGNAPT